MLCNCGEKRICGPCYLRSLSEIAINRSGQLLSYEYKNSHSKLLWQCKSGHQWQAVGYSIKGGTWCPICAAKESGKRRSFTLDDVVAHAQSKRGKCLSKIYSNCDQNIEWQCENGHTWFQSFNAVKHQETSTWCPYCRGAHKTIEDMQLLATKRGGKCLSTKYCSAKSKLEWQCQDGHVWKATQDSLQHGSWCPYCKTHTNEEKCRFIFESLTKLKFPKDREALGNRLELDGYNDSLKLAFEYQGKQHYVFNPHFHYNEGALAQRKKTDALKVKLCQEKGITLIVISYWYATNMLNYIKNHIPSTISRWPVYLEKFYRTNGTLAKLNKVATARGGRCLSKTYMDARSKLKWECAKGHVWEASSDQITGMRKCWCPFCRGLYRTIKDMQTLAQTQGGKCLSKKYIHNQLKLKWECAKGHRWEAAPAAISRGQWCSVCMRHRKYDDLNIDQLYLDGETATNIAKKLHICEKTVHKELIRHNIKIRNRRKERHLDKRIGELYGDGHTKAYISRYLGYHRNTVARGIKLLEGKT